MIDKIFDSNEFDNLGPLQVQQKAQVIKQRFDMRRSMYHSMRNLQPLDFDKWNTLNRIVVEFDKNHYTSWNNQWRSLQSQQNSQAFIKYFNEGKEYYREIETFVKSINPPVEHSQEVEQLKEEILSEINHEISTLTANVNDQIKKGIQDLIDLKAEFKLQTKFADNIKSLKDVAARSQKTFLIAFISSLILISTALISTFLIGPIAKLELVSQYAIRIAIALPLGFFSYFLFSQYKVYQVINFKFTHLDNFIGGGATFISELIGVDETTKKETNKKLANMFMDVDDIIGHIRRMQHPTDASLDAVAKTFESLAKSVTEMRK
jgi:hypothetical protein